MRRRKQTLVDRLVDMCNPENIKKYSGEIEYIELTNTIAEEIVGWSNAANYSDFIEFSADAINLNVERAESLDLDTCMATMICVQKEHENTYKDIISERIQSGSLFKLAQRISKIAPV